MTRRCFFVSCNNRVFHNWFHQWAVTWILQWVCNIFTYFESRRHRLQEIFLVCKILRYLVFLCTRWTMNWKNQQFTVFGRITFLSNDGVNNNFCFSFRAKIGAPYTEVTFASFILETLKETLTGNCLCEPLLSVNTLRDSFFV